MKKYLSASIITVLILAVGIAYLLETKSKMKNNNVSPAASASVTDNPLSISTMRNNYYPGSELQIEENLPNGANYTQQIVSYKSDNLKIYALLLVPTTEKPQGGYPVVVFNHGYIPPEQYKTTEKYVAYQDAFARNGYIVLKSDYRGNGNSEGLPTGAYYSPGYAIDVLNAVASIKRYKDANPEKIGMWGHSMGGNITLRDIEVTPDIKVAVIWSGVVGSYDDLMNNWQRRVPFSPSTRQLGLRNSGRGELIAKYKTPKENPAFWNSIDPLYNINFINIPIQIHHSTTDEEVPIAFSQKLASVLTSAGKTVEFYTYDGANHNLSSPAFELAMQRSVDFFDKYLK